MKIYNGKNSQLDLPLSGNTRVVIAPHSVSGDVMPSDQFLTMMAQSFEASEVALIIAGPYEINMCARNPACSPMVVQSLDEAIERFSISAPEVKEEMVEDGEPAAVIESSPIEETVSEPEEVKIVEESEVKKTKKANKKKSK